MNLATFYYSIVKNWKAISPSAFITMTSNLGTILKYWRILLFFTKLSEYLDHSGQLTILMAFWHIFGQFLLAHKSSNFQYLYNLLVITWEHFQCVYCCDMGLKDKEVLILMRFWRFINLFTTIHDGNFRRHSSMNVTIKWHNFSSNIYYIHVFFVI